ncbi:MAG TPA: hypothetical protein VGK48_01250 [Terriglobia bacterium]|jgi:hypothetical protein
MIVLSLALFLLLGNVDVDVVTMPLTNDVKVVLAPSGRVELKREGTVSHVRVDIDRVGPPANAAPAMNTYVVWAVSPEGAFDNLGELDAGGGKGQFSGTTRLTEFGLLITAEPHYMVDRPSATVVFRTQNSLDPRRKTTSIPVGAYDYSMLKPISGAGVHASVTQARTAFQIAQLLGADQLAPQEFRNAQVAMGSLQELLMRAAPLDIIWPTANEAIRWSEKAAEVARGKKN